MNRTWIKLLIFLIPSVLAVIFLIWRYSPTQVMTRRVDALFSLLEVGPLSHGAADQRAQDLKTLLADELDITGPDPLPAGPISKETAARHLKKFQTSVRSCTITRDPLLIAFRDPGHAVVETILEVDVRAGATRVLRFRCRLEFRKAGRDWLLDLVHLTPI